MPVSFGRTEAMLKGNIKTPRQSVPNPLAYTPKVRAKKVVPNKKRQGIVTALGSVRG